MEGSDGSSAAGTAVDHHGDHKKGQPDPEVLRAKIISGAKKKLAESGEKTRLKMLLRQRLEAAGWGEEMQDYLREVVRNRSLKHVDIGEVVEDIAPPAVPDVIKLEIADRIEEFLTGSGAAGS
ncbi:transcription factor e(y)2-domain-containing protein [Baffinella frigidus]|nr:transcription factor e(y)2-domain-containing protein [Cryptophyta sp. CCMP2293]